MDWNPGWFISNLLIERVVINWSFTHSIKSGNDDDNNNNDNSGSSERVSGAKESDYGEEK